MGPFVHMNFGLVVGTVAAIYLAAVAARRKTNFRASGAECVVILVTLTLAAMVYPAVYGTSK